jgi:hypothetical protein
MSPIELETIKIRLEGVRLAIGRCRFAFFVSMIASVAILVTVWNAYMSADSDFARQPYWSHDRQFTPELQKQRLESLSTTRQLSPEKMTEVTDQVQQEIVAEWVKNQVISIGLLGIRVSVGDLSIIGSLGLLITAILWFYSVRSENLSIGNLLKHAYKFKDWDERYYVFQGISPHLIFVDLGHTNKPIMDFHKRQPLSEQTRLLPLKVQLLMILPALTILMIVAADIWTVFRAPNPFRPSGLPLWQILDGPVLLRLLSSDAFAAVLFVVTLVMCSNIIRYAKATGHLIEQFRTHLLETCDSTGKLKLSDSEGEPEAGAAVPEPAG